MTRKRSWLLHTLTVASALMLHACVAEIDSSEAPEQSPDESAEPIERLTLALGGGAMGLRGVNLAGAEFGNNIPGSKGVDYAYPTRAEVDYFMQKGMTVFRIPFMWERLQRQERAELNANELSSLTDIVGYATSRGASVVIDPHNYARYYGRLLGSEVSDSAFADLWTRLANRFKSDERVIFGLMNEPNTMRSEQWARSANVAIQAIRATGASNLILVPGVAWSGAHSWLQDWYGTPNAQVMLTIRDPLNNMAFEAHQYLDGDASGTNERCAGTNVGDERMRAFTGWLRQHGKKGFLGEFGAGRNQTCMSALESLLSHLDQNADVYLGFTYWAAGPMWGEYIYTLEPRDGQDRPQMAVIARHLSFTPPAAPKPPTPAAPQPPPPAPPSEPPPATPTPPATGGGKVAATMSVSSSWQGGYCADVRVTNAGRTATASWTVRLDDNGAPITQLWNGLPSQSGGVYTIKNVDHNRAIPAGGHITFGFCANSASGRRARLL